MESIFNSCLWEQQYASSFLNPWLSQILQRCEYLQFFRIIESTQVGKGLHNSMANWKFKKNTRTKKIHCAYCFFRTFFLWRAPGLTVSRYYFLMTIVNYCTTVTSFWRDMIKPVKWQITIFSQMVLRKKYELQKRELQENNNLTNHPG